MENKNLCVEGLKLLDDNQQEYFYFKLFIDENSDIPLERQLQSINVYKRIVVFLAGLLMFIFAAAIQAAFLFPFSE